MMPRTVLSAAFVIVFAVSAPAQAPDDELPALPNAFAQPFGNGAVLQRDCDLPIWGTSAPRAAIAVFLDSAIVQTTADDQGHWRAVFPPQKPGRDHHLALVVNGRPATVVEDIAIGDVWFCAGNDEMAMSFYSGIENGEAEDQLEGGTEPGFGEQGADEGDDSEAGAEEEGQCDGQELDTRESEGVEGEAREGGTGGEGP